MVCRCALRVEKSLRKDSRRLSSYQRAVNNAPDEHVNAVFECTSYLHVHCGQIQTWKRSQCKSIRNESVTVRVHNSNALYVMFSAAFAIRDRWRIRSSLFVSCLCWILRYTNRRDYLLARFLLYLVQQIVYSLKYEQ